MTKNGFPKPQKIKISERFFAVLGVAKRRKRLGFSQRVALDFPNAPRRPKNARNRLFSTDFRENFRDRGVGGMRGA